MTRSLFILTFVTSLLFSNFLSAQISFEQKLPIAPVPALLEELEGIYAELGCIEFADVDNDNDQDVIISGQSTNTLDYEAGSKLFLNQGDGSFRLSEINNAFDSIVGRLKFCDIDNDGYKDFFICGKYPSGLKVTQLHRNLGNGNFSLVTGTNFEGVYYGGLDIADIDGDNDQDLIYTGYNGSGSSTKITRLYKNNGSFNFTLLAGPFADFAKGECQFADIDGDSDKDIIITGLTGNYEVTTTTIYTNNGTGTFTSQGASGIANLYEGNVDFGDVDNDGDLDLLVSGITQTSTSYVHTKLYLNNGLGSFTLSSSNPFSQLAHGNLDLVDMDNDNDLDVYIMGQGYGDQLYVSQLYLNDGTGVFVQNATIDIQITVFGSCAISDVNNDNYPDILMNGQAYNDSIASTSGYSWCMLYINNGINGFRQATGSTMPGLTYSTVASGDIDNDGDNDLFIAGQTNGFGQSYSGMYKNDGLGNFALDPAFQCPGFVRGASCFIDFDNDNDNDLIVLGISTDSYATIFVNDGNGNFNPVLSPDITNLNWSSIQAADFDNDGDMDIVTIGETGVNGGIVNGVTKFYRNENGTFNYYPVQINGWTDLSAAINLADLDNDGDIDFYAYGGGADRPFFNDGGGNFTCPTTSTTTNVDNGQSVLGDIDGDNDADLIITGTLSGVRYTKFYSNSGNGNFNPLNINNIPGVTSGSMDLIDIDLDGDLDLFITGAIDDNVHCISNFYLNNGSGSFSLQSTPSIKKVSKSNSLFSQLNNDNIPDLILLGKPEKIDVNISNIYINNTCMYYSTQTIIECDSYTWIDGNIYTSSTNTPVFTLNSSQGCDSVVTLNLTIIPSVPTILENTFSLPSDPNNCLGEFAVNISGNADFELNIDGLQTTTSNGYSLFTDLCPGIHDLQIVNFCGDTTLTQFVIPIDSNYVFNNPFIDSLAQDSLGVTLTDCDIYYAGIDTAYIDSIWANGNTVNVIWNIIDSNGSNFDTTSYVLNNGNGVYWLQLSVFCPNKSIGDYFAVTEAIYFENGNVSSAGISEFSDDDFVLYPNPTNDLVTISFDGNNAHYTIYDAQGKLIQTSKINSGGSISLKDVQTGVYFFELTTENGSTVKRVVKN